MHSCLVIGEQVGHMGDGVAGADEEFVIELHGSVSNSAVELLNKCDISLSVVLRVDAKSEEGVELWNSSIVAVSPAGILRIALADEDFGEEDLLEERIPFCLVVNLEMVDFQVQIEGILLGGLVKSQTLDSKESELLSS